MTPTETNRPGPPPKAPRRRVLLVAFLALLSLLVLFAAEHERSSSVALLARWWKSFRVDAPLPEPFSWTGPPLGPLVVRSILAAFLEACVVYAWFVGLGLPARLRRLPRLGGPALLLVNLGFVAGFLALVELPLYAVESQHPQIMLVHPRLSEQLVPGARLLATGDGRVETMLKVDPYGFRAEDLPYHKPEGTYRVFLLGDSAMFGIRLPQRLTAGPQLEQRLRSWRPDVKFEVLNGAVCGAPSGDSLWVLEHRVVPRDPDLVLVGHNNDGMLGGLHVPEPGFDPLAFAVDEMAPRSALVRIALDAFWVDRFQYLLRNPDSMPNLDEGGEPANLKKVEQIYLRMAAVARQHHFQLAVVGMPESVPAGESYVCLAPAFRAAYKKAAEEAGVPFLDMKAYVGNDPALFLEDGYHLDAQGQARFAQGLFEFIKSRRVP